LEKKMKKLVIALGIMAAVVTLAGCASKGANTNQTANDGAAQTASAPAKHDFKGEGLKK
jgi:hypothetical protein